MYPQMLLVGIGVHLSAATVFDTVLDTTPCPCGDATLPPPGDDPDPAAFSCLFLRNDCLRF